MTCSDVGGSGLAFAGLMWPIVVLLFAEVALTTIVCPTLDCTLRFSASPQSRFLSLGDGNVVIVAGGQTSVRHLYDTVYAGQYLPLKFSYANSFDSWPTFVGG